MGSRVGTVVRELASHQCGPGLIPGPGVMWVEFVVGSLLCSERFFSGYSGFPLSLKTNISKFQFDSGMHGHFWTSSCELLSAPWVNKLHLYLQIKCQNKLVMGHMQHPALRDRHGQTDRQTQGYTLMTCQNSMTFHDFFHDLLKNPMT